MAKPMPGARGAAEHFRQPVVAAAPKDRVLRTERAVGELKRGASVVVESAHQAVVQLNGTLTEVRIC